MKTINLAFIINSVKNGGPSNVVQNIIKELPKEEYQITLITLFNENDETIIKQLSHNGIKVIEKNYQSKLYFLLHGNKEIEKIQALYNYDIIHTHGFIPDFCVSKSKITAKKITTIHCNLFEDYREEYGILCSKIYFYLHIKSLKKINEIICCSDSVRKSLEKHLKSCKYILNGITLEDNKQKSNVNRKSLGICENSTVYIYVGRLEQRKNVLFLIKSFVKYHQKNEYLLILGDGSFFKKCKKETDSNVILLGFQKNPIQYYNISDYYISASKSEGLSISVIEAMGCGLGVFLSNIPSHQEIMKLNPKIYIGELFTENNFNFKLQELRNNKQKLKPTEIKRMQNEILSAKSMGLHYHNCYKKLVGE